MVKSSAGAWLLQIEGAHSASELVRLVGEYIAAMDPQERARLLAGAESIDHPADIQVWAVTLAHLDLKAAGPRQSEMLHEAAMVFAAAGAKLAKVAE